jgi:hypothetical protein
VTASLGGVAWADVSGNGSKNAAAPQDSAHDKSGHDDFAPDAHTAPASSVPTSNAGDHPDVADHGALPDSPDTNGSNGSSSAPKPGAGSSGSPATDGKVDDDKATADKANDGGVRANDLGPVASAPATAAAASVPTDAASAGSDAAGSGDPEPVVAAFGGATAPALSADPEPASTDTSTGDATDSAIGGVLPDIVNGALAHDPPSATASPLVGRAPASLAAIAALVLAVIMFLGLHRRSDRRDAQLAEARGTDDLARFR